MWEKIQIFSNGKKIRKKNPEKKIKKSEKTCLQMEYTRLLALLQKLQKPQNCFFFKHKNSKNSKFALKHIQKSSKSTKLSHQSIRFAKNANYAENS